MFSKLKLRNRILLGYIFPMAFLIGLGCLIYAGAMNREVASAKTKRSQNTIISADKVTNGLSKMVRNVRGNILFPQDESYQNEYEEGLQLFREATTELDKLVEDPQERQQFAIITTEVNRIDEISRRVFDLVKKGDVAYAKILTASLRLSEVEKVQAAILQKEKEVLATAAREEKNETGWVLTLIVVGTGLSAAGSLSIGLWIASDIGQMMNQAADAITSPSTEIAATVEQQERTASQQAVAVNQTTITMDELGASSRASAQQAESAATGAHQALKLAEEGTQAVGRTLEGMATLKEKVEAITAQIGQLSEQTQQIGNISAVVSELANQTNMLALNAAVEAARAGQNGKGFSVIATEIRQLADRSKQSAEKINDLVSDIQRATHSTVIVTKEGRKTVDEGMQLTEGTAEAFSGVADAIHSIVMNSQQISLTAQQQAIAVQQVVDAMKTLNQGAEQTASGISQTKVGTQQLKEAAQNLKAVL